MRRQQSREYQQQQQQQQSEEQHYVEQRMETQVTRQQVTSQQRVQGEIVTQTTPTIPTFTGRPGDPSPPVFEQIFKNARFAQGGNAIFEGRVRGTPKPVVSWIHRGAPLLESQKFRMSYDERTGIVMLQINQIGPGDEGEYTCHAKNQYGEAICSVYIQPEGFGPPPQQGGHKTETYQRTYQQTYDKRYMNGSNGSVEDFKVDTFEYRILRETEYRESITRRFMGESDSQISQTVDRSLGPVSPPQITQKPRNSKLMEGSDAVFVAKISGNPKPRLTWFKNGQRLRDSQHIETSYSNQQATLKIRNAHSEDGGHYSLLTENPQGCTVSSAYLAIESSDQVDHAPPQMMQGKETIKSYQTETVVQESAEGGKVLAPNFVRTCTDRDVTEGKMTRFDCRVTGRPYPEVTWYINNYAVSNDATHKILVNESGNNSLMITNVSRSDSGVVTCIARNKAGETSFQCNLNVIEKEQVLAPKFVERFTTANVKEGEPVNFSARAVGTPMPRTTWQKDGVPIVSSSDVRISSDGSGASSLDIQRTKFADAGWYQCTAQNIAGTTATRARLFVETPKGATPEPRRLNLPRPTKVIEPEPAPGPEVIYLRHVERAKPYLPPSEEDRIYPPPRFIIPLRDLHQIEGGRIHFEARIEPVGDPTMRVEWYVNGRALEASSRSTSIFQFGFISLDLISVMLQDSGEYICRIVSSTGAAESRATLGVTARATIEQTSQHPDSLRYIQQLEDYSKYQRQESVQELSSQSPVFIRPLQELGELQEGRNAHFEAQLTPVSDSTMRVEWYKDGRPITASSRITTIFNFGYVSLNILHLRAEDAGSYTVRAVNRAGEAISSASLRVYARTSVTGDLGIPEQQRYIEAAEELEAYQQAMQQKYVQEQPERFGPPEFKTPIKDQISIREGGFAHFEARLEPVGDSNLRVEWLKDGRPVEASSRITTFFNFGYVALTIKSVSIHDVGIYTCRAYNRAGETHTTAQLSVITKNDIIYDSQHPMGLQKIQTLEDSSRYTRKTQEDTQVKQAPRFLGPLKGTNKIVENQRAHFEARVEPQNDLTMKIEWYHDGKPITAANRIQTYHDFGYVAIDIMQVRSEDAGTYTVVARNALGEARLQATMVVETRSSIDTSTMHRGLYEKTSRMEDSKFVEPHYHIEEISKSKPIFVQPLNDPQPVSEGKNIHLECRLEPMGDPTMRVEWFQNGKPVTVGSRFRTYYDFGFVALDIVHTTALDSGEYTVRATNHLGTAHTSACVRVIGRSDVVTDSQHEQSLEQIQMLEDSSKYRRTQQEDVTVRQAPQFTRPLHNIETVELTNVHLECRLQPVGDSSMRVDWFVNGRAVKIGHRFRPSYEFDYVALDILGVYPEDSGVYTCQARNHLGEAVTSCSVRVHAKKDLVLESQHPEGLERIQYLEDASRYKRNELVDEVVTVKPRFVTHPKNQENLREGQHAHFECKLEPVTDSNLKVEWYKNGRPVTVGHRFRPIHDFGYVALDVIDLIAEDSGTYTCRAVNLVGTDEVNCTLSCKSTAQILTDTQNETGLEQINYLEDRAKYHRREIAEETTTQAPIFTSSLNNVEIKEGQRAHFECRLIPVSDASMKVEWFHNNNPVKAGSRFVETNSFGFVALDIMYAYPEDSGTYTCRARNAIGDAITSATADVHSKKSIYLETQNEEALQRLRQLEDTSRYQRKTAQEEYISQAPVFTMPIKDLRVAENQAAHFEARVIPVGDSKLKIEWLRNGVPIAASNRVTTMHDFGYVALNMKYVNPEDSGTYTCRAVNDLGEAVTSACLFVQSKAALQFESQHESSLSKLQALEDTNKYQRREEEEFVVKEKPSFTVQLNGPKNLVEGQSAHYECRIEPYPDSNMKVEWFHNGKPLSTGHRYRTTCDFGFASLDILSVYAEDSGTYTCKATNKLGQAQSSINLDVKSRAAIIRETQHEGALKKIQYLEDDSRYKRVGHEDVIIAEKPKFGRPLKNIEHLPEGKSAHLEATLTPVNDPTMVVEWFRDGKPIPQGHKFKTTYDFGYVALDILYAYPEDSGTYMCKARNIMGEAVTTCVISVDSKQGLYLDTLDAQRLEKIRELETVEVKQEIEKEVIHQKPVFLTALNSLDHLKEGEHAHLECRVEPINDANLKIEWFVNGVAVRTGHRFRTTHDFGYVALDILYAYSEDSGTYMCKATNLAGEAVNTCTIKVGSRRSILLDTQHPDGLEKIRELEAQGHPARLEVEEPPVFPPRFITELRGTTEIYEGQTAHFECQVEPLHDANLRIEFFHNGKPLPSASRFHVTFDFGYVALDIGHAVPEDAGQYSVRAINALGQCVSSIDLKVIAREDIIRDSQRPEGLEKIRELESQQPWQRPTVPEPQTRQRPVFTQPLQNIDMIPEGKTAHFECRLIPVGDPTLKVEWFRNETPLETSSRITKVHDFGYVSLDLTHVRDEDEGVYMCRASNALGEAVTTASMSVQTKANIQMDSHHPEAQRKIARLEADKPSRPEEPEKVFDKPIFTQLLSGPTELWEGQIAHYECRVVPVGDATLRFEWFVNGVELKMGSRFHVNHDFGFVTLDIMKVIPEDSGVYTCKAINKAGEAVSSISLKVKARSAISGDAIQPDAWKKIQLKEAEMNKVPEMFVDTTPQQAPVFTTHLKSYDKLVEGQHVYLEAQVEPRADPNLRVEWFKNGVALQTGTRLRSTFDFGLVTLSINGLRDDDSALYTCKATNLLGEAVSTSSLKIVDRHWLLGDTLHPDALSKIDALEQPHVMTKEQLEPTYEEPVFITHLNNVECTEGDNVHFECNVEPSKDPTMKIEWFLNGKPLPTGARYKSTYDFGYVALDMNHAYEEDSGLVTVKATNSKGSAQTTGTLKCTSKQSIYLQTQHPQGEAGLDKVKEVDDAYLSKAIKPEGGPEKEYPKPVWVVPLQPEFRLGEAQPLHLEGQVEPKDDPNLKIEWYFNAKALEHGSRFKMTSDFGFVTLDLTDAYDRDSGIYTCKAYNKAGEAFTSSTIYCTTKESIIERSQHPKGKEGLEAIQDLEESLKRPDGKAPESDEGHPPVFTSQFDNLTNLSEGEIAHFEASLTPTGDQTMVVEWFYNGKPLEASHRTRTVYAFGMVVLEVLGTKIEDSGTYSCRATNKWGKDEISVTLECVDRSKGQKPKFTTHIQSLEGLKDGQSVHFECTLIPVGDPHMKVEWFHNGKPLRHSSRYKMVSDFGFVVMDIAGVMSHDTGEYVCKASNKFGEDYTKANIKCFGKSGVYLDSLQPDSLARIRELESYTGEHPATPATPVAEAPKFITQITDITRLVEGQSAHFEARLTPITDPDLKVEWYYNGKKLPHGHRYRTFHDFGIVILDILYCYEENSGVYECRAVNKYGEDSTKATLRCLSKANLILESQLPKGMEGGLEKIQTLEDSMIRTKDERITEERGKAPVFTVPLSNLDGLREGESSHFEARLTPTDDPKLKVEWFWNGKPLKTGSRFRTFCDFGFVILEISPIYPEDSGEYSCRATNDYGEAVTTCSMKCTGKRSIILESQLPKGMESTIDKIAELEGLGAEPGQATPDDDTGRPPEFITTPSDLALSENSLAHFECRLQPVNDSSMRVEWFHNGKALLAGSRVKTIHDFGFVILEVANCYQRDSGHYTCKATNRHGEATVSCKLQVRGRQGIILEPQLPSNFKTGTESIQKLEEALYKRDEILTEEEKPNPPRFVVELKDIEVEESGPSHFDCRLEPVSDPSMRVDWFHNGRPFATGSRVHQINDFGFISLDMSYTYARDSGEYVCRATNKWGTAQTKATITCKSKKPIDFDSQLPTGMSGEKLKELERGPVTEAPPPEPPRQPPRFITQIQSVTVEESENVRFECRVEPKDDPNLRIEWYRNGKSIPAGHRYRTVYDMGFVSMDILYVYAEDSGEYVCKAINDLGEDTTKASVSCKQLPSIILQNQVPKGMKKSEALMQMEATIKKYTSEIHLTEDDLYDADKKQPPRFVTQIKDQVELVEMNKTKFECQLAPVGDPNMKVEWFFNGKPLHHKNRFTPIYDFGYVAMNFGWVYPEDSGEYVCRATNLYGMDETRAVIKTAGKPGIIYESQLPKGMKSIEKIREMEAAWQVVPEDETDDKKVPAPPTFVSKPEPVTVEEGDCSRFCCRVTGYPKPRVIWRIRGNNVANGARYKLTYDGMYHLDIPKTRQYDHGKIEVIARSSVGEASTETTLTVKPRSDDYRGVLKNSPRPWYDSELTQYQTDRLEEETELKRVFDERHHNVSQGVDIATEHLGQKVYKEPETDWQKSVKTKKSDDYYSKLMSLEEDQVLKESRLRESTHQFAIPGEKIVSSSVAKGMAQKYQENLEEKPQEAVQPPPKVVRKPFTTEVEIDTERIKGPSKHPPGPSESTVHGREVHTAKQKQTQKEIKGDTEITRKITATETTEVEHKGKTQERVVQGQVKPAKPPVFTKKIQPCRAFEQEQARFEVEFDGDPLPTIKWYREDFPIQNSSDLQIHTFSTKSILIVRQVFMEDSGVFSVIAENRGGKAKCSANLVVEERRRQPGRGGVIPPSFITTIQSTTVTTGQLARFDAKVTGTKPLDVYWLKNGKKISPDIHYKTLEEDNTFTLLILESVVDDTAKYECVALNSAGEARCDAECTVRPPQSPTKTAKATTPGVEKAPGIVEPLRDQSVKEGASVAFSCKINGKPVPTVQWKKGDKIIKPSKYFQMQKEAELCTLRISEAFPEDEGVYKCIAKNPAGEATTSANLRVLAPDTADVLPKLTPLKDQIVMEGQPAQFKTQVSPPKAKPTIQWYRNGALIPQSPDFQMIHEGNNAVLLIATTYEEDTGTFTCRATTSAGTVESSAKLVVKKKEEEGVAPHFISPVKPLMVQEHQPAILECVVSGTPGPEIKWYRGEKEIKPVEGKTEISFLPETGEAKLTILEPTPEDETIYRVRAINKFGRAECRANLIVRNVAVVSKPEVMKAPKITKPLPALVAQRGTPLSLEAEFESTPKSEIKWFHNGVEIIPSKENVVQIFENVTELVIPEVTTEDSGKYEIRVQNQVGEARSSGSVSVKEKLEKVDTVKAPRFIQPIQPQLVAPGEVVIMETMVESYPTASFQWFHENHPLESTHEVRIVTFENRSVLLVQEIKPKFAGTYTCRAENTAGSVTCTATVNLQETPWEETVEMVSPTFVKRLTPLVCTHGDSINLTCVVQGKPIPKVQWYRDKKPIQESKTVTIFQDTEGVCSLAISNVMPEDTGNYTCQAINPVGEAVCTSSLVVEAYEYIQDSEVVTSMIKTSRITEKRGEVEEIKIPLEEIQPFETEEEYAPKIVKPLPQIVPTKDGELTRLEVKVTGKPKPEVKWFKQGLEIHPSQEFQIEESEDGTSILTITETYPDDTGEITFEAHNPLGVSTTTTYLSVEGIVGTKEYRKPEWVTHMEEMQEALRATQSAPSFIQEMTDEYRQEGEQVVFECSYAGNPTPDVVWYKNDKLILNTENLKIRINEKDNKTTLTIKHATHEDDGTYVCKVTSDVGLATSKAKLHVSDYTGPERVSEEEVVEEVVQTVEKPRKKKKPEIKKAKEHKEKLKTERVKIDKTTIQEEKGFPSEQPEDKKIIDSQEVQVLETIETIEETPHKPSRAKKIVPIQDSVITEATPSLKMVDEKHRPIAPVVEESATKVIDERQGVLVSETSIDDVAPDFTVETTLDRAQVTSQTFETISVTEVHTETGVRELKKKKKKQEKIKPSLSREEEHIQITEVKVEQIIEEQRENIAREVEEIMDFFRAPEFGPGESPLRELATIGFLVRQGVSVNEINESLYRTDKFPALRTPDAQNALVQLVERKGHGPLITQVLTEETTTDESIVAATVGFRAFMKMVELQHASVEEVITHFTPEDFRPRAWEVTEVTEHVETEQSATETIEIIQQQTEIHVMERREERKAVQIQDVREIKGEASLSITKEEDIYEEVHEGDTMFSICSYVAETDEAINLVEGERVYIIEHTNSDWWFVRKNLTQEKGWVPAQYLLDEAQYTIYLQRKLHEKIDKLPVFEKPAPGEKSSAPRFVEKLQPIHTPDGYTVQFECQVEGAPRPQITWFRQTAIIKPSPDFQMYYDDDNVATLIIKEVFPEDAGTFTCVAKNAAGFASSTTELTVESPLSDHGSDITGLSRKSLSRESSLADILEGIPPTFSRQPKAKCVKEGDNVILECRLVAVPEPEITWFFEETKITTKQNTVVVTESDMHMYCSIMKITKIEKVQEGKYTIVAKNREGEATIEIPLKVQTGNQEPPEILEPLKPFAVREGETVVLSTQIVGNPPPKITWLKDGKPLKGAVPKQDGNLNTLTLIQPQIPDSGEYCVVAKNDLGTAETRATLTVEEMPTGAPEPPLFTERFQEVNVPEKSTFKLIAKVTGNPVPEVTWLRNNKPLEKSPNITEKYDGENISLEIKNADSEVDAGDYKCVAVNPVGKTSHGAKVTVDVKKVTFTKNLERRKTIDEYTTLELTCETSHTVSTTWWHNDKEISGMDHQEVVQEGRIHKLVIKKISQTDEGNYKCTVKNQKTICDVTVKATKPEFVRKLQDFEVIERDVAILEVEITSQTADVKWTKDGQPLTPSVDKIEFVKEGTIRKLFIRSTSVHDEGEYTCVLVDEECSAEVTVVELPPEIITKMQDVTIAKGEKATFEIELTKGDALVRWFKDNQELQFSEHVQLSIDGKRQRLKIYNTEPKDAGVYSCKVGQQTSSAKLTVEEPGVEFIRRLPEVTIVSLNEDAVFEIELSQDVPVKWMRKGQDLPESPKYTIIDNGPVKKLIVKDCTVDDALEYSVIATNVKTSSKLKVEVVEAPPTISMDATKIYRVRTGDDVEMTVNFTAAPHPSDEWTVDRRVIKPSKRIIPTIDEESASLTIKKIQKDDVGDYTLKLTNVHGDASINIKLVIIQTPSPPGAPEPSEVTDTTATLHWTEPESDGNSPIIHYILEYHEKEETSWKTVTDQIFETMHTVTKLTTNKEYTFRTKAVNEVGPSEPSPTSKYIKIAKPAVDKPGPPRGPLEVSGMTKTSFTIKWQPPESDGGSPITEYVVEIKESSKKTWKKLSTTKGDVTHVGVPDLKTDVAYEFKITAKNNIGAGPPYISEEPIIAGKRLTPPSPPTNVHVTNITSRSVTLEWSPPLSTGGSELTGYVIEKRPLAGKGSRWTKVITLDSMTQSHVIENLKESEFLFRVFAENSLGLSLPTTSEPVLLKSHASVPSQPTAPLEIRQVAGNTISIEWGRPEFDGGAPLEAYKIAVRDAKKTMWMEVGRVNPEIQRLTIRDLQENHEYFFRIYAKNEVGFSEPLESEEPFKILPASELSEIEPIAEAPDRGETTSLSFSTENTSSWLRDHNMDADIHSYARGRLLRKDEYFFRIWHYAKKLFK